MLALLPASLAFPQMVAMSNAADAGMQYPVMGLGTAGGSTDNGFGVYPECWASCVDGECQQPDANGGCGQYTIAAIETWFQLGGRRIDSANGYRNQNAVGRAIRESSVPRSDIFFQTKIGPYLAMGYNESLEQAAVILNVTGLTYIDNLMLHWPSCETGGGCGTSTDPVCNFNTSTYDDAACRLSTWRALLYLWKSGVARSVGVSNFNISHLQEISDAGLVLPSLNQVSFSLYHSAPERDLLEFCSAHGILFNGWVPFSRSDSWVQQPPCAPTPLEDPSAIAIAARYNTTPASLILAFQAQAGVVLNPRSQNAVHMMENLGIFSLAGSISEADMTTLWTAPQSICEPPACTNPVFKGCVNNGK